MPGATDEEELPGEIPDGPAGGVSRSGSVPPLATAPELRELSRRMLDAGEMLEVFRRELPACSSRTVRILACSVKPAKTAGSRRAIREGRCECVYRLEIEGAAGHTRELVLQGMAPVAAAFPGPEIEQRCRELFGHPAAEPFERLALRLAAMPVGLLFFPLDPALPALAEVTGPSAPELLAPHLSECRSGARIASASHELRHYKPRERAVLRVRIAFAEEDAPPARSVYVKLFSDEHGSESHRDLCVLWEAARRSRWLRVPEPLGYDARRRMLVLAEVPGERALAAWIHCLEHGVPLPPGVDLGRVESCVLAAARSLAELQRCGARPRATRTFADVLASLHKDHELLTGRAHGAPPELVARALALIERLEAAGPGDEPLVPSHGGARHKQTIGDEHGLTFVDWDGFCLANPALDAATFLARLRLVPIVNAAQGVELERLAEKFREEFVRLSPAAEPYIGLYEGLVLTEQMLRSFRRSAGDLAGFAGNLARAAEECFAEPGR